MSTVSPHPCVLRTLAIECKAAITAAEHVGQVVNDDNVVDVCAAQVDADLPAIRAALVVADLAPRFPGATRGYVHMRYGVRDHKDPDGGTWYELYDRYTREIYLRDRNPIVVRTLRWGLIRRPFPSQTHHKPPVTFERTSNNVVRLVFPGKEATT